MQTTFNSAKHLARRSDSSDGLRRIRRITRYLKLIVLLYFVFIPLFATVCNLVTSKGLSTGWYWEETGPNLSPLYKCLAGISMVIYFVMAAMFYRLLNLLGRGIFFATDNVRLLRRLGHLTFANGLLSLVAQVVASGQASFDLGKLFASPMVIGGLVIVLLSHIMEEACKLREEQALTV